MNLDLLIAVSLLLLPFENRHVDSARYYIKHERDFCFVFPAPNLCVLLCPPYEDAFCEALGHGRRCCASALSVEMRRIAAR